MTRSTLRLLGGVALPTLLAACSGGVGDGTGTGGTPPPTATPAPTPPPTPAPTPPPTGLQNQFGACFTSLFGASTEVEETEPAAACLPPIDFNTEATAG